MISHVYTVYTCMYHQYHHAYIFFTMYRTKWTVINGVLYKLYAIIVLGVNDDYPVFGQVCDIFASDSNIFFKVKKLITTAFSQHHHMYTVEYSTDYKTVSYDNLYCNVTLHLRQIRMADSTSLLGIVPKYHILRAVQT